jgi:peptide/nickel transport system permease protein
MLRYVLKRATALIPLLAAVSMIIFGMLRLTAIDPVTAILGGGQTTAEEIRNIRAKFHLDESLPRQYLRWIAGIFRGDLGLSFRYQQKVSDLVADRLPVTFGLVVFGTIFSTTMAIPTGVACACRRDTWVDRLLSGISLILVSSPVYLVSILFILFLSVFAPSIPFTGSYSNFGEYLIRILPPSLALAFGMMALMARVTRNEMIKQLDSAYVQTAIAKGLSPREVVWGHAFKNAAVPLITIGGLQFGFLIVGSVLVEIVFSLPGLGSLLVGSIQNSDYPIAQGVTLLLVTVFLLINLTVDLLYAVIDPRIQLA